MERAVIRFGGFEVDLRAGELRKGEASVRLQEQPLQILAMLLDRPGDTVTREELRMRLWPDGTTVDFEHSVNAAIKRLRAALGDAADRPRYVETLHRRGYRFIAPVERVGNNDACRPGSLAPVDPRPRLVVLPFKNLSGDPAQEYFSDGLTEEIIAQLGRRSARHQDAEAIVMADRACELDPLCLTLNTSAATVRFFAGDYEGGIRRCRYTLDMEGQFVPACRLMSACLVQLGRYNEAVEVLERLPLARPNAVSLSWMGHALAEGGNESGARDVLGRLRRLEKDEFVPAYHVAFVHAALGETTAAFALLERACEQRDPWLDTMGVDPRFRRLRSNPRFAAFQARLGLGATAGP